MAKHNTTEYEIEMALRWVHGEKISVLSKEMNVKNGGNIYANFAIALKKYILRKEAEENAKAKLEQENVHLDMLKI